MVIDLDDFGADHRLSDVCSTHDCRDKLDALHYVNGAFKVTLFAVPDQMTPELLGWCSANNGWVELAQHGFTHSSNFECLKMTEEEFGQQMEKYSGITESFVHGFKAPGWQISDDAYKWLLKNDWWVADQSYNDDRRPKELKTYLLGPNSWHGHTWDCVGCDNGIYASYDYVSGLVKSATEFKFVSEVV